MFLFHLLCPQENLIALPGVAQPLDRILVPQDCGVSSSAQQAHLTNVQSFFLGSSCTCGVFHSPG